METLKKLNYLFDVKLKLKTVAIFIIISIGSLVELLGIAIVLPVIELAMADSVLTENEWAVRVMLITKADTKEAVLLWLIAFTVAIYIAKAFYLIYMNSRLYLFSTEVRKNLAMRLMQAYFKQPYEFFLQKNSSELIRGVNKDTESLYSVVINVLRIISNGITAVCIVVFLFMTNFWMTLVISVLMAACAGLIFFVFNKRFRRYGVLNQKYEGQIGQHLKQAFEGVKEIKIMGNEDYFVGTYENTFQKQSQNMNLFNIYNSIPKHLIETVCISGILLFLGANIVFNDNYTALISQLAAFCVAAYKLMPSVNAISAYLNTVIFSKASIDLVYQDIKEVEELEKQRKAISIEETITFHDNIEVKNVSFQYAGTQKKVLKNVNFSIKKGQSIALIGPSGGGKTTLADIMLGLLEPIEGEILVDGTNIYSNHNSWGKNIGYIPQAIYLTDDSIRNNIAFGINEKDIDDEKVWAALEGAQLKEFVKGLPNGLDTEVGERGARLSGGQRQRIGIARALYRNPDILVFDEATSALDTETEKEVMKSIDSLHGTKTMIMIAHRLSTIENCDVVFKVEKGQVERQK